jgi:hypothetical protein
MWIALDTLWWHNVVLAARPYWQNCPHHDVYEVEGLFIGEMAA